MSLFADIWKLLDRSQRRRLVLLQAVGFTMAATTLAGIAAVVPFFAALGDSAAIERNLALAWIYRYFGFSDHRYFLVALGIVFLSLVVLSNAINLAGSLAMYRFAHRIGNHFCVALFDEYIHRDHQFHIASNSARLFNNIVWEVSRGVTGILQAAFVLSTNAATCVLIMISIVLLNPLLALIAVTALASSYGLFYRYTRRRLLRNGSFESLRTEDRTKTVSETLGGIREIIAMRGQRFFRDKFERTCWSISRGALNTHAISQSPRYILECIIVAGLVGIALLLVNRPDHGFWLAQLSFLAFSAYRLLPALQQMFQAFVKIQADRAAFDRIADDLRCACRFKPDLSREPFNPAANPWWGLPRQNIQLTQVNFRYSTERPPAVRNASLTIAAGMTVGLVGASGSGKTTLAELILGLLRPSSGTISIDGIPLADRNRAEWHTSVGYVPQHNFLFDASVAENIALATAFDQIDFERLREAIALAQLDSFVNNLPNGYREILGERGVRLSGGQRQRIGIARALYRRTSVLILDEATNALDSTTEREIMSTLEKLRGAHTIIVIAHRMSTVRPCDLIYELESGCIIGSGTFDELMQSSPRFRSLLHGTAESGSVS
ncbi:MAG TPA: ABC transporter ATP-binding protein [Steroidobacteraceae bacterium]|jgi:ABC-type multidrug transport system fused ATPase/permease subunit|nr:ABC transporter ATP-binding protein [Steroidobacteraceae bacterium]